MIYELKNDLVIPFNNPGTGYRLFPKSEFGLSYARSKQDFNNQVLCVDITINRLADKVPVAVLAQGRFTASGRNGKMINQEIYAEYSAAKESIAAQANSKVDELKILEGQHAQKPVDNYNQLRTKLVNEINSLQLQHAQLPEVTPEYETVDTYQEVIKYFTAEGPLTEEGLNWAIEFEMMGNKIKDLVILPDAGAES